MTGLTATGRTTVIKSHLENVVLERTAEFDRAPVHDCCYVFNFSHPDQPGAIRLDRGQGRQLVAQVADLLELLKKELHNAFTSDAYKEQARELADRLNAQRQDVLKETERLAREQGFALQASAAGVAILPLADGKPIEQAQLLAISKEEQKELDERRTGGERDRRRGNVQGAERGDRHRPAGRREDG